ncbi:MAG: hypothetical protein LPK25_17335 [Cyclobacteriaceae bacterium]|nr:hypothetical protein [Cyclobacteriaceae bacterium]MDX5468114.1 hypothetical protein [Cyclobacteriaceae bacterium]
MSKSIGIFSLTLCGLLLFSLNASAQTENEKVEDMAPKSGDRPITPLVDDHTTSQEGNNPFLSPGLKTTPSKTSPVKRDLPAGGILQDKDPKKAESPSTLSFNIFLYVVDKFKDNNLKAD